MSQPGTRDSSAEPTDNKESSGKLDERVNRGGRPVGEMLYGLKEARIQADLDGKTLAQRAGVHEQTVRKLENFHAGADPRTTLRLAKALGVKRSVLRNEPEEGEL